MSEQSKKSTKAQRRMQKREQIAQKKKSIAAPKMIRYHADAENELVIVKGEIDGQTKSSPIAKTYIRFKLSGQHDFLLYGYQAKIPVEANKFQFEIPIIALLEQDEIAIQAFNEQGQASEIIQITYKK